MACCSFPSWISAPRAPPALNCVRVVHVNGFIEDYDAPITAGEITGKPPIHMLCSLGQLLLFGSKPIGLEDRLEPGRLYFLLPFSFLQTNSSPVDMISLLTRLTELARETGPTPARVGSTRVEPVQPDWMTKDGCGHGGGGGGGRWRPELETIEEKLYQSSRSLSHNIRYALKN